MVPEEEVGDEAVARILAAEADHGESISHGELKQRPAARANSFPWNAPARKV